MLGIVILNYNTWDESIQCIESMRKNISLSNRIYLVDNLSPKKPSEEILGLISKYDVELIYNTVNSGYAAGNNVGLKKAYEDGCDAFLISNSDVLINDDSIDLMNQFALEHTGVGVVGPIIYDVNGVRQPIHMLSKLTASGKIKNMLLSTPLKPLFRKFQKGFVTYEKPTEPLKVFGVSGCCFLITKKCYESVFPFDENTFLYEEEYILGCRLEEKDIEAYILPGAQIVHAEAVSTGGMSKFSYNCLIESEQYYLKEYIHSNAFMRSIIKLLREINWIIRYKGKQN